MVNIFGGIAKCDIIANGIVEATRSIDVNIPVIVRLAGTNAERGMEILRNSGWGLLLPLIVEAALKSIEAVGGGRTVGRNEHTCQ